MASCLLEIGADDRDRHRNDEHSEHHRRHSKYLTTVGHGVAIAVPNGGHRHECPPEAARDGAEAVPVRGKQQSTRARRQGEALAADTDVDICMHWRWESATARERTTGRRGHAADICVSGSTPDMKSNAPSYPVLFTLATSLSAMCLCTHTRTRPSTPPRLNAAQSCHVGERGYGEACAPCDARAERLLGMHAHDGRADDHSQQHQQEQDRE